MAKIFPFRAVRPPRSYAHLLASRTYSNYTRRELRQKLDSNPYSFLHIINPDFHEEKRARANSPERFQLVREKYRSFLIDGVLDKEAYPCFYIYRQTDGDHVYTGVIGGAATEDYENNVIKKHEATLTKRERLFRDYLDITGFNAEPVLLTYPDDPQMANFIEQRTSIRSEYEFHTTDGVLHELWVIDKAPEIEGIMKAFSDYSSIYIADGHHRSASSALLAKEKNAPEYHQFLAYFIPESNLTILPFHRLFKGFKSMGTEQVLEQLEPHFTIEPTELPVDPGKRHHFGLCLFGDWFYLKLKEFQEPYSPVEGLDVQVATKRIIEPVFGITDQRNDKRISFVGGEDQITAVNDLVKSGKYQAALTFNAVSLAELKAVADANEIMPPKSTWIAPKLRSGMTIYSFD